MERLNDRVMVGLVSGVVGYGVKVSTNACLKALHVTKIDTKDKAAGMFLRPRRHAEPVAVAVGVAADFVMSSLFGVGITYFLSVTGGDKATLKGAFAGAAIWATMYGGLSNIGVTANHPVDPKSALGNLITNTVFGAATAAVAERVGAPAIFNGEMPLIQR